MPDKQKYNSPISEPGSPGNFHCRRPVLLLLIVVALTFVAVCGHEFTTWDDDRTLRNNPHFKPPTLGGIVHFWRHPHMSLYVPVTYTVWGFLAFAAQVDDPVQGPTLNPWIFHTASVLLHGLSVLVVFAILRLLLQKNWPACIGAILFGVHPVQVEPVAWASGMKDLLCGLLSLLAVWQYLLYVSAVSQGAGMERGGKNFFRRAKVHYGLGLAAFVLAMLSKPTGIIVPLLAGIFDLWILRRSWRQAVRSLWPWFILMIPCIIWTKLVQPGEQFAAPDLWQRPFIAGFALAFYLYKLFFPAWLAIDYGHSPASLLQHGWIYAAWIIPAGLAVWIWMNRHKRPWLAAAGLIFIVGVSPVLGLIPFHFQYYSTVADHYLYLAMLGPAAALAWFASRHWNRTVITACALILSLLSIRSIFQTLHWRDSITLFEHTISVNDRSFMGHNNLGNVLLKEGDLAAAQTHLLQSLQIKPDHITAYENMITVLVRRGEIDAILRLMRDWPPKVKQYYSGTYTLLGRFLLERGRFDEAIEQFQERLKLHPDDAEAARLLKIAQDRRQLSTTPQTAPATLGK